jgi:hypothetical protein
MTLHQVSLKPSLRVAERELSQGEPAAKASWYLSTTALNSGAPPPKLVSRAEYR